MKYFERVLTLIIFCVATGCGKDKGPDLSPYTPKLAGEYTWKLYVTYSTSGIVQYFPDETFPIIVNDNEHVTVRDQYLTFKSVDDSVVVYSITPNGSTARYYNYLTDSVRFDDVVSTNHAYSVAVYRTRLE